MTASGRRALAVAVVLGGLGALGPFAAAASAQPPVDPDGSATRWSFDYVQAAVDDLVSDPLPAAYGGVTVREYFYDMGVRLWAAIALIMVVVQGLKVSMGGRLDMWGLVSFLLWIAFPLMVLEGFYTPYAAFGNQTFIQMVTGQGQALASALNEGGGAFAQLHDRIYAVLSETFRHFGIALSNAPWSLGGLLQGLDALIATLISLSVAAGVLIVGIVLLLIACLLVYTQVVWANVALGVLTLLGPVFVPFLLVEQMSFLFWSWLKGLIQYSFQVVVAALLLRMIAVLAIYPLEGMSAFVASLAAIGSDAGDPVMVSYLDVIRRFGSWIPVILAALLLSFKVGELTQVMLGGSQNLSSGLTAVAAGAAATLATGGAAAGGALASAGLSGLAKGAASHGMKGTAAALSRGARAADWVSSQARGRKGRRRGEDE